jgi:hypothetical protein
MKQFLDNRTLESLRDSKIKWDLMNYDPMHFELKPSIVTVQLEGQYVDTGNKKGR